MAAIKLTSQTIQVLFRRISTLIYALRPKFNNSIKPNIFSSFFGQKQTGNDHLLKFALAIGFISISGVIGILVMLVFGTVQ